jgi:hypothetical protein
MTISGSVTCDTATDVSPSDKYYPITLRTVGLVNLKFTLLSLLQF